VEADHAGLKRRLREAGLSDPLIEAAWPAWWSEDAASSRSAAAELRFSLARKLGLSPESFYHDDVQFIWKDEARFKNLSNETEDEKEILTSFGISIGRMLAHSTHEAAATVGIAAQDLRAAILSSRQFIDLQALLATCWAIAVPVLHLRIFPLHAKRMHAMATKSGECYSILLGRDANYPAPVAFTLAHEIGHVMLGHVSGARALVDVGDPLDQKTLDAEELAADQYALELLLGSSQPEITTSIDYFNAPTLAQAALTHAAQFNIEPGTLALCLAHQRNLWAIASSAMNFIYSERKPVWQEVNKVAAQQLDMSAASEQIEYLARLMGLHDG
jgi:Zn-dependent peptidase ImmA (M78 family)